jgi:hypothetical protein
MKIEISDVFITENGPSRLSDRPCTRLRLFAVVCTGLQLILRRFYPESCIVYPVSTNPTNRID